METGKRKPGRPRAVPLKSRSVRGGISNSPKGSGNVVELNYNDPENFKRMWAVFEKTVVKNTHVICTPNSIKLYGETEVKNTFIFIRIDGKGMDHFYGKESFDFGLSTAIVSQYTRTIDKETESLSLVVGSAKQVLKLVLKDKEGAVENHPIAVRPVGLMGQTTSQTPSHASGRREILESYLGSAKKESDFLCEDSYKLSFNMTATALRRRCKASALAGASHLIFAQDSRDGPLVIKYHDFSGTVESKVVMPKVEKMNLKSKLEDGESFRVCVAHSDIKSISAVKASDDIRFFLDEDKDMLLICNIGDEALEMRILVKIITKDD